LNGWDPTESEAPIVDDTDPRAFAMECRRVRQVVFLYTDNEMGQELLVAFREHLELCPHCLQEVQAAQRLLTLLRARCARRAAPEGLRLRIVRRLTGGF